MPVRNGEKHIAQSIESILNQSFSHFELIIADDCSTDETAKILRRYTDSRIRYIRFNTPQGLAAIRQKTVNSAQGAYVAFLDSDDVAYKNRLQRQYIFLNQHTDISCVGAWAEVIDAKGRKTGQIWRHQTRPENIRATLFFRNCITQSTMMMRRDVLNEFGFRKKFNYAPDYDLWTRVSGKHKIANQPEILVQYRMHGTNMSKSIREKIIACDKNIYREQFKQFGLPYSESQLDIHMTLERQDRFSLRELMNCEQWLLALHRFNGKNNKLNRNYFDYILSQYWFRICALSSTAGPVVFTTYAKSPLYKTMKHNSGFSLLLKILCSTRKKMGFDITSSEWMDYFNMGIFSAVHLPAVFAAEYCQRKLLKILKVRTES